MHTKIAEIVLPFQQNDTNRRQLLGHEPMIYHCHHYNIFLQQSIHDASYIDSRPFLIGAAAEVAFSQLSTLFSEHSITEPSERKVWAETVYKQCGFGILSLDSLNESGGSVGTPSSHYVRGWDARNSHFADEPICYFTNGWIAGALSAIYNKPDGYYRVHENRCAAMDERDHCHFIVDVSSDDYYVYSSVGGGVLAETHNERAIPVNNVDYDGIYNALTGMDISGNEKGIIPAFGVYLTRHYANYYNRISFELMHRITDLFGEEGKEIALSLLTEAGRVCAFNTFGGIMKSPEWDALIRPSLKTKEDWTNGIVAAVNALGWGRWQVINVTRDEADFVVHDDYESSGYLAMHGKSDFPVSCLAKGAAEGIMNLVYIAKIENKPTLDMPFYENIFKELPYYTAKEVSSKAMGDEVTQFRVTFNS